MKAREGLPKAELAALRALVALQVYGRSGGGAAVGSLWPRPLHPEAGPGEQEYGVDEFAEFAGLAPKEVAQALGGLRDRSLLLFTPSGLGVTAAGTLAALSGAA